MPKTVTLIIHGTFAAEQSWWRLGSESNPSFADKLELELASRGIAGTVWKPVMENGLGYEDFSWSGKNRHSDRIRAAKRLCNALQKLADKMGADSANPLRVNFVAHSHGGNVVLEALRKIPLNVRANRIALLGTPLITALPAFRIARLMLATILLGIAALFLLLFLYDAGHLLVTCAQLDCRFSEHVSQKVVEGVNQAGESVASIDTEVMSGKFSMLGPLIVISYGWLFWTIGNLLDVAWRVCCRSLEPLAWIRGKSRKLVYGPAPRKLEKCMNEIPILCLQSQNDEAELLLSVGTAPDRLYREYVRSSLGAIGRALEIVFVRPFLLAAILRAVEMVLERAALGVSLWRTLFLDYQVATIDGRPYYSRRLLVTHQLGLKPATNQAEIQSGN